MTTASELSRDSDTRRMAEAGWEGPAGVAEKPMLELLRSDHALPAILDAVCRSAEQLSGGSRCGIYLIDWSGPRIHSFVAPSLPASFSLSLCDLPVRHDTGPYARAACLKITVIAADLEADPFWRSSAFHLLAATYGLRSCWASPIHGASGQVLGILAILHDHPANPASREEGLVERLARVAGIAVERAHTEAALERASAELARVQGLTTLSASVAGEIVEPLSGIVINASTGLRMLAASPPNIEGLRDTLSRTLRDCGRLSDMVTQLRLLLGPGWSGARPPSDGSAELARGN